MHEVLSRCIITLLTTLIEQFWRDDQFTRNSSKKIDNIYFRKYTL